MTIELNTLATTGIPHPSGRGAIKVAVFATPLDLPGRDKFFWLRGFNSVQGCPICVNIYPSHLSQVMHLGTRRQLPADSPLRQKSFGPYEFISEEERGPAPLRTTQLMKDCLRMLREDNLQHVCGFAGRPMFDKRIGFDWVLDGIPEAMHIFPRIFLFFANVLCGGRGGSTRAKSWRDRKMDLKLRSECQSLGIFKCVWPDQQERLSNSVRAALLTPSNSDIASMTRPVLERWLRAVGEDTKKLRVPQLKRRVIQLRRQLNQPGDFYFTPLKPSPLPWQLSRTGFNEVDVRIKALVFPLNTEHILKDGKSFLNSSAATGKSAKKHLMLLRILPTVLRGFVPALRRGLRFFVLGWRILDGQVHSFNQCLRLNIEPGCRSMDPDPAVIKKIKDLVIKGLSMITGAVPPSLVIPYLHIVGHYPDSGEVFGILGW